jgi:deoxyribodipyrimidine photo-lyase
MPPTKPTAKTSRTLHDQPEKTTNLPAPLRAIADDPRVTIRRDGIPASDAKSVVYWMQRAERGIDNPALDTAIALGNELGLPVIAFFSAISNFPHANLRHYRFLNQGLPDIEEDLAERNVSFIVRRPPDNKLEPLLAELGAAIVIGDENPMREPERWRAVLAHRLQIPFWTVDADVIVPSNLYPRHFYMVHHFRPKLYAEMPRFLKLDEHSAIKAEHAWERPRGFESFDVRSDMTEGWRNFDRSVAPVEEWKGGTHEAIKLLRAFVKHKLAHYDTVRNHPEKDGTSRISPALHFGHIGPLTVVRAIEESVARGESTKEARDAYYGEVLAWRELAINFVKYVPNYDSFDCAPDWAQQTLRAHARDKRDPVYTQEQLERGETYDEMWNAAQQQMTRYGWMHNYLRMYWAKKILEWSATPAQAWETCVHLNDKYFLDGRDPNGYAGIAWALGGVHDRPWFDRPIFGTVRYMSGASTGKKFDSKRYIQNVREGRPFGD